MHGICLSEQNMQQQINTFIASAFHLTDTVHFTIGIKFISRAQEPSTNTNNAHELAEANDLKNTNRLTLYKFQIICAIDIGNWSAENNQYWVQISAFF